MSSTIFLWLAVDTSLVAHQFGWFKNSTMVPRTLKRSVAVSWVTSQWHFYNLTCYCCVLRNPPVQLLCWHKHGSLHITLYWRLYRTTAAIEKPGECSHMYFRKGIKEHKHKSVVVIFQYKIWKTIQRQLRSERQNIWAGRSWRFKQFITKQLRWLHSR